VPLAGQRRARARGRRAHLARPVARARAAGASRARARAAQGTRFVERSLLSYPDAPGGPLRITVTPLVECYVGIGTGYGFDADWRHGMYQGPLVVQGVLLDTEKDRQKLWGICDNVARFEVGDQVGYGLHEYLFLDRSRAIACRGSWTAPGGAAP
jgi:hypothetical protein